MNVFNARNKHSSAKQEPNLEASGSTKKSSTTLGSVKLWLTDHIAIEELTFIKFQFVINRHHCSAQIHCTVVNSLVGIWWHFVGLECTCVKWGRVKSNQIVVGVVDLLRLLFAVSCMMIGAELIAVRQWAWITDASVVHGLVLGAASRGGLTDCAQIIHHYFFTVRVNLFAHICNLLLELVDVWVFFTQNLTQNMVISPLLSLRKQDVGLLLLVEVDVVVQLLYQIFQLPLFI